MFETLDTFGIQRAGSKTKVGQFDVSCPIHQKVLRVEYQFTKQSSKENNEWMYLWFQVPMDVSQAVQFTYTSKHLCNVKACMFLFKHA